MIWRVYIVYALSGKYKYNFIGDKVNLMTLIGCIVSTSIEQCRITYENVDKVDESISTLKYFIYDTGKVIVRLI